VIDRASVVGWLAIGLVVASGIVYSLGAAVYALKRPNPFPRVFGYHEVFHAFVVAASVLLFVHVAMITS
jgi:hemolysin III